MTDTPKLDPAATAAIRAAQDSADEQLLYTTAAPIAAWLAEALARGTSAREIATHLLASGADPSDLSHHLVWGAFLIMERAAEISREITHPDATQDHLGPSTSGFSQILAPCIPILELANTNTEAAHAIAEDFSQRFSFMVSKGMRVSAMLQGAAVGFAELMDRAIVYAVRKERLGGMGGTK